MGMDEFSQCMATELSLGVDQVGPVLTAVGDEAIRRVTNFWNAQPPWLKAWVVGLGGAAGAKYKAQVLKILVGETGAALLAALAVGIGAGMTFGAFEHCSSHLQ